MHRGAIAAIVVCACGPATPPPTAPTSSSSIDCDAFVEAHATGRVDPDASHAPAPAATPRTGAPRLHQGRRIVGDPNDIPFTYFEHRVLENARVRYLFVQVKVCLDTTGAVRGLQLMRQTGLRQYEHRLCDAMKDWRYDPWTVDDIPVPVCTEVRYIYARY